MSSGSNSIQQQPATTLQAAASSSSPSFSAVTFPSASAAYIDEARVNAILLLQKDVAAYQIKALEKIKSSGLFDTSNSNSNESDDLLKSSLSDNILSRRQLPIEYANRLVDNEELTLLSILDSSGLISTVATLTEFMVLMTRVSRPEHKALCLYIIENKLTHSCSEYFIKFAGLKLLRRWLLVAEESDCVQDIRSILSICKKLPFDMDSAKNSEIGKVFMELKKFKSSSNDVTLLLEDVKSVIADWKEKVQNKTKFASSDSNSMDVSLVVNISNSNSNSNSNSYSSNNNDIVNEIAQKMLEIHGPKKEINIVSKDSDAPPSRTASTSNNSSANSISSTGSSGSNSSSDSASLSSSSQKTRDLSSSSSSKVSLAASQELSKDSKDDSHMKMKSHMDKDTSKSERTSLNNNMEMDSKNQNNGNLRQGQIAVVSVEEPSNSKQSIVPPSKTANSLPLPGGGLMLPMKPAGALQLGGRGLGLPGNPGIPGMPGGGLGMPLRPGGLGLQMLPTKPPLVNNKLPLKPTSSAAGNKGTADSESNRANSNPNELSSSSLTAGILDDHKDDGRSTSAPLKSCMKRKNMDSGIESAAKKRKKAGIQWALDDSGSVLTNTFAYEIEASFTKTTQSERKKEQSQEKMKKKEYLQEKERFKATDTMQANMEWREPSLLQLPIDISDFLERPVESVERDIQNDRIIGVMDKRYYDYIDPDPLPPLDYQPSRSVGICTEVPWDIGGISTSDPNFIFGSSNSSNNNMNMLGQGGYANQPGHPSWMPDSTGAFALHQQQQQQHHQYNPQGLVRTVPLQMYPGQVPHGGMQPQQPQQMFANPYHINQQGGGAVIGLGGGGQYVPPGAPPPPGGHRMYAPPTGGSFVNPPPGNMNSNMNSNAMGGGGGGGGMNAARSNPGAPKIFTTTKANTPCRFFNSGRECSKGDKCEFSHIRTNTGNTMMSHSNQTFVVPNMGVGSSSMNNASGGGGGYSNSGNSNSNSISTGRRGPGGGFR